MRSATTLLFVVVLADACSSVDRRPTPCGADPIAYCDRRCLPHLDADPAAHEGRCEKTLGDLCRAQCAVDCGDASAELARRIADLDDALEHDCGSGRAMRKGDSPNDRAVPTRRPLDRLIEN